MNEALKFEEKYLSEEDFWAKPGNESATPGSENEGALNHPVELYVERVLAKVSFDTDTWAAKNDVIKNPITGEKYFPVTDGSENAVEVNVNAADPSKIKN